MYDPVKAHNRYIKKRNKLYWANLREELIDKIMWDRQCSYKEAALIYNEQMKSLYHLKKDN
jgi:hypothetical protein